MQILLWYQIAVFTLCVLCLVYPKSWLPSPLQYLLWMAFVSEMFYVTSFLEDYSSWPEWAQVALPVGVSVLAGLVIGCATKLLMSLIYHVPGGPLLVYIVFSIVASFLLVFAGYWLNGTAHSWTELQSYLFWVLMSACLLFRLALWLLRERCCPQHATSEECPT